MNQIALSAWNSFLTPSLMQHIEAPLLEEIQRADKLVFTNEAPLEELDAIHSSWIAPFLRTLPEREIKLFLAALCPKHIKELKQTLLLSNTLPSLTSQGRAYLRDLLWAFLSKEEQISAAYLPFHPLHRLLALSYEELLSLIDLLSMHDLSADIRHIIDTAKLKKIDALLSKAQISFLKTLLHKKESVSFKKLDLHQWQGDLGALHTVLVQRGINRMAKALYPYRTTLIWHIAHHLDSEKGELLLKLCTPLDHPQAYPLLETQVITLINSIRGL